MGLMDKVKQVAGEMGELAKKGASQVQTKVEQTQLRRKADDAAKRLGYLVHRERTGGDPAGAEADALVAEIKDAEEQMAAAAAAESAAASTTDVHGTEMPPPAPGQAVEEASGE
jgi:seryl-tRNA synthetase